MLDQIKEIWATSLGSLPAGGQITVARLSYILLLLIAGYGLSRLVRFLLSRRLGSTEMRPDAVQLVSRLSFYAILTAVVLTALTLLEVPLTAFAFVTGAVAIGVGFGAQNVISNFISGWILMTERPIRIDDFIEIDGVYGVVERIGNRSTRVRRTDGVHMLVPNSQLLEKTVVNWTLVDLAIRNQIRVGVAYGSDVETVSMLLNDAVVAQPQAKQTPKPIIIFEDFGDNALIFDVFFWCDVSADRELRMIRSDIRFRIVKLFNENNITIAFPQRDVHFDVQAPIPVEVVSKDD